MWLVSQTRLFWIQALLYLSISRHCIGPDIFLSRVVALPRVCEITRTGFEESQWHTGVVNWVLHYYLLKLTWPLFNYKTTKEQDQYRQVSEVRHLERVGLSKILVAASLFHDPSRAGTTWEGGRSTEKIPREKATPPSTQIEGFRWPDLVTPSVLI